MARNNTKVLLRLPTDLKDSLTELSERKTGKKRQFSQVVREALEAYVERNKVSA